jgi:two-component system, LuxR family, response regulator FixJ
MSPVSKTPTVYVVDDDRSVRESLSSLLRSVGMLVQTYASPAAFLDLSSHEPHSCLVLDVRMPEIDGLDLHQAMLQKGWNMPVIFITGHGDVPLAVKAMRGGAIDFLNKPFSDTELLAAVDFALAKLHEVEDAQNELDILRKRYESLTPRERQILEAVSAGKANKVIAYDLDVTESTIKVHRHNAMLKMNVRSVAELTRVMDRIKR